jgi:alkylated DNA repair protein alkB family protein 8
MKQGLAQKILNDNTKTWDAIAKKFDLTRHYIWDLKPWAKYAKPNTKVLDLGCGNGRFFELLKNKGIDYTGIDNSKKLIELAKKKYLSIPSLSDGIDKFVVGNALNLPFKNNYFDLIYSVAVFHHIPSKELRLRFLKEAKRVLKKDGKIVLTVWYLWQRKYLSLIVKYSLLKIIGKSKLDFGDLYIPWQNKQQRYYHAFRKKELVKLFKNTGFEVETKYLKGHNKKTNILIIAHKTKGLQRLSL